MCKQLFIKQGDYKHIIAASAFIVYAILYLLKWFSTASFYNYIYIVAMLAVGILALLKNRSTALPICLLVVALVEGYIVIKELQICLEWGFTFNHRIFLLEKILLFVATAILSFFAFCARKNFVSKIVFLSAALQIVSLMLYVGNTVLRNMFTFPGYYSVNQLTWVGIHIVRIVAYFMLGAEFCSNVKKVKSSAEVV